MWREIFGLEKKPAGAIELRDPVRSFADVILPEETRKQLFAALTQIKKHRLIFQDWGLGERHPDGSGLAFNFAGPPGTGKSVCAEAVAYALGKKLLRVDYAELQSCWAGQTGKNIRNAFRDARNTDAVLLFDEADSVAARRFSDLAAGYEREANHSVNILLKELDEHPGVVIFATNMAANFDPAFERRLRTHILFRIPGVKDREQIWRVQVHPEKTPLGTDVDFDDLAERYPATGGDIRNAVLKAAQLAAAEEGPDQTKRLLHRHFQQAMEEVLAACEVMSQNAINNRAPFGWPEDTQLTGRVSTLESDLQACRNELEMLAVDQAGLKHSLDEGLATVQPRLEEVVEKLDSVAQNLREEVRTAADSHTNTLALVREDEAQRETQVKELAARVEAQESRLQRATLLPWPKPVSLTIGAFWLLLTAAAAASGWILR
jgi:AAA+ superfamily predicted ATPase